MANEFYTKFKVDIKGNRCWILDKKGMEVREIPDGESIPGNPNKWSDKWGSQGFTIWNAPDWAKSGRTTWVNFKIREGGNWHKKSWQGGRELKEKVLECFYKHYDLATEGFKYWKRYYNLGEDFWQNNKKGLVLVEFTEEFRVEKQRETGNWIYINKKLKSKSAFEPFLTEEEKSLIDKKDEEKK